MMRSTIFQAILLVSIHFGVGVSIPVNHELNKEYGSQAVQEKHHSWPGELNQAYVDQATSSKRIRIHGVNSDLHDQIHLRMLESILRSGNSPNGHHEQGHSSVLKNGRENLDDQTREALDWIETGLLADEPEPLHVHSDDYLNVLSPSEELTHGQESSQSHTLSGPKSPTGTSKRKKTKRIPWTHDYNIDQQGNLRRFFDQLVSDLGYTYKFPDVRNDLIHAIPKVSRDAIANGTKKSLTMEEMGQLSLRKKVKIRWTDNLEKDDIIFVRQFARERLLKGRSDSLYVINGILASLSPQQIQAIKNRNQVEMNQIAASFPVGKSRGRQKREKDW